MHCHPIGPTILARDVTDPATRAMTIDGFALIGAWLRSRWPDVRFA